MVAVLIVIDVVLAGVCVYIGRYLWTTRKDI